MYVFCYKYDPTCEKYLSKTFADPRGCRGVAQYGSLGNICSVCFTISVLY